jgi:hypothetical protein
MHSGKKDRERAKRKTKKEENGIIVCCYLLCTDPPPHLSILRTRLLNEETKELDDFEY